MLLQFIVENYKSFHTETVLSLVPAKKQKHANHVISQIAGKKVESLPIIALYGANASGKSNLVEALKFARNLVINGTRGEMPINRIAFKLDEMSRSRPSRFEFIFTKNDVLYHLGFLVNESYVEEEWLFAYYSKQESRLYERKTIEGKVEIRIGENLAKLEKDKKFLEFVAKGTRPNQLFLTEAYQRDVKSLIPLIHWFEIDLTIISPRARYAPLVLKAYQDSNFLRFLEKSIRVADVGITSIFPRAEEKDLKYALPEDIYDQVNESLKEEPTTPINVKIGPDSFTIFREKAEEDPIMLSLQTSHESVSGDIVKFELDEESDGTIRFLNLIPAVFHLTNCNVTYVVDELDQSLHPLLCKFLINAFLLSTGKTQSCGQLIFTTHETHILDLGMLRKDEIWFVEKDKTGDSHLTSLAEFDVRSDLRIDKGYLNGRFGAIPFLGNPEKLIEG